MPTDPAESRRLPSLDGIRAVAIVMVLFWHASNSLGFPAAYVRRPTMYLDGKLGVRIFFILSGFLITTLLLQESRVTGKISLGAFYKRRALRILPVYYFYILAVAVILIAGGKAILFSTFAPALTFTTSLWGNWGAPESWPLAHTWSLAMEEQFYFTWPALLFFFGARVPGKIWVPFLILIAPILRWLDWENLAVIDHVFFFQGDSIASGCLLAILMERRNLQLQKWFAFHPGWLRLLSILLVYNHIFIGAFCKRAHLVPPARLMASLTPTLQCLAISYLIGSLVMNRRGVSYYFLNLPMVQSVGRLSYSLYIWQQLTLVPYDFHAWLPDWTAARWAVQFPQNLVMAFIMAIASYYLLELPMLRLKARFSKTGEMPGKLEPR